jgi:hypothetical protein
MAGRLFPVAPVEPKERILELVKQCKTLPSVVVAICCANFAAQLILVSQYVGGTTSTMAIAAVVVVARPGSLKSVPMAMCAITEIIKTRVAALTLIL